MPEKCFSVEKILSFLEEGPPRIEKAAVGLTPEQLHTAPGQGEWSARDVLAHLHACGDVWGGHICAMLAEERPERRGINPRTWIQQTAYLDQDFHTLFRSYAGQRAGLLEVLKSLPPEGWSRTALMVAYGQGFEHTVQFFGDKMARHERAHLRQIEQAAHTMHNQ